MMLRWCCRWWRGVGGRGAAAKYLEPTPLIRHPSAVHPPSIRSPRPAPLIVRHPPNLICPCHDRYSNGRANTPSAALTFTMLQWNYGQHMSDARSVVTVSLAVSLYSHLKISNRSSFGSAETTDVTSIDRIIVIV